MTTSEQNLASFLEASPWVGYGSAIVSFIAHRAYEDLRNLACSIVFEPTGVRDADDAPGVTMEVDQFTIHQSRLGIGQLAEQLVRLGGAKAEGILECGGHRLLLFTEAAGGYSWRKLDPDADAMKTLGWCGSRYQASGPRIENFVDPNEFSAADVRLSAVAPFHFASWDAAARSLLPAHRTDRYVALGSQSPATLDLHFPVYVRFSSFDVTPGDGQARIEVEAPGLESSASFAVVLRPNHSALAPVRLADDRWVRVSPDRWSATEPFPADIGCITAELIHNGARIQTRTSGSPPTAARVYAHLDADQVWLSRLIGLADKKPKEFEAGLVNLLNMGGLSAVRYGIDELPTFPDLVAVLPAQHLDDPALVLVGECTIEAPGPTKIDKLASRAQGIVAALSHSHPGVTVLAAIFCPTVQDGIPPEAWRSAKDHRAVLVGRERLMQIYDAVLTGRISGRAVWQYLAQWV
jgi:hypothetical protein